MVKSLEKGLSNINEKRKVVKQLILESFSGSSRFAAERNQALLDDKKLVDIFFNDFDPDNKMYQKFLPTLQRDTQNFMGTSGSPMKIFSGFLGKVRGRRA